MTILFADETSILVSNPNPTDFKNDINIVFELEWFKANLLSINFNKTHFIRFTAKVRQFQILTLYMTANRLFILLIQNF